MAIQFPADGTYLTLPAAPKWGSTTCCWFRQPSTIYVDGGVGLLSFGTAGGYGACMVTQNLATNQFTLRVLDSSFRDIGCSYIRPDTWYFLALTVSSSGSAKFHIGMAGRAGILSSFDAYQTISETGQRVFGALGNGSYNDTGAVCWVKAWSAELSVPELIAEMSGSSLVRTANAFSCCPLPDVSTLTDTSGQGHPVTIVGPNASTVADVSPVTTVTLPTLTTNLVVACVGDSRTEGVGGDGTTWPGTLQTLRTGDTVVNDGSSGMGSQGDYLRILQTVLPRWTSGGGTNVKVCLIHNGINDIANGVSLNRILGNMRSSIDLLLTHGPLAYPVFMSELADGVSAYNAIEQDLSAQLALDCSTLGIKFIDFRTDTNLMDAGSSYYLPDARHLNATGYTAIGTFVDAAIDAWYTPSGNTVTASDSATAASDTASAGQSTLVVTNDSATAASDTTSLLQPNTVTTSDSATAASDTTSATQPSTVTTSDSATAASDTASATQPSTVTTSDSATAASDTTSASQPNTVTTSDSATAASDTASAGQSTTVSTSDSATAASDSATANQGTAVFVSDIATQASDTSSVAQPNTVTISDSATAASDTSSASQPNTVTTSDSATQASDSASAGQSTLVVTNDSATAASDTTSLLQGTSVVTSDSATQASDTTSVNTSQHVTTTDSATAASDTISLSQPNTVTVTDSATAASDRVYVSGGKVIRGGSITATLRSFGSISVRIR